MSIDLRVFQAADAEISAIRKRREYIDDPVLWARDYLGVILWSKQKEILYSIRDHRKTAVAAGHGVGKSFVAAVAMAWWIDVHPLGADETGAPQTFVASTAPFADQITAILWNNVRILHGLSKKRHAEYTRRRAAGEDLEQYAACDHALPGYITGDNKWKTDDGILIGQGRKPPDNKTDSGYQGLHATYLLAIGDEAAGLHKDMVDALGNITTGEYNRMLLIANPTDPNCEMAQIWKRQDPKWVRMHISVFDSPKVTNEPDFPKERMVALSGQDYIDEMKSAHGEEDATYISRVLGQWAFEAGNTVFAEIDLARAANTIVLPDPDAPRRQGWDIARMGNDATVGYEAIEGEVWETDPETGLPTKPTGRRGLRVRYVNSWRKRPLTSSNPENLGSAQLIDAAALASGAILVNVDASGLGSGAIDGLMEIGSTGYYVYEVFGNYPSTDKRAFVNMRAEQYFELQKRAFAGELDLDPKDSELFDELRGIVYEFSTQGGARKIESKESMKKRGVKSPDYADALWYAAIDTTLIFDDELAGMKPGDQVTVDPWAMLETARDAPGMPM